MARLQGKAQLKPDERCEFQQDGFVSVHSMSNVQYFPDRVGCCLLLGIDPGGASQGAVA